MGNIAVLTNRDHAINVKSSFLNAMREQGFKGEIETNAASRAVYATDNSIYYQAPYAIVFPTCDADVALLMRLMGRDDFRKMTIAARGGGTGTNGQSLVAGITIDFSRHMTAILDIDVERRCARVQPGVVKDQLNAAIAKYGLFFAPELSTSNRASIGGMINTDASGQGSRAYGKTHDHVLGLRSYLIGGTLFETVPLSEKEMDAQCAQKGHVGDIHRVIRKTLDACAPQIAKVFPPLTRSLTGYDLVNIRDKDGGYNLNHLLCGSEGTLGIVVEAKLHLMPIPRHVELVVIGYAAFMDALRDADFLMAFSPLSIETLDQKVLSLARLDPIWFDVARYFPASQADTLNGVNFVEFVDEDPEKLTKRVDTFLTAIKLDNGNKRLSTSRAIGHASVKALNAMRKRAVGLLGNVQGNVRPQPFIEDTVVPPQNLANYIAELRALLDGHDLDYGMFGHIDAGVLHVRPLLDMRAPLSMGTVRLITDAVVKLTRQYGGILWGEHGKGLRSEFVPETFGPLYPALQQIKAAFDPYNQLNPGKIATPSDRLPLTALDAVMTRGQRDREIPPQVWESFGAAMHCNGNAACTTYDVDTVMCPSWQASRDRRYSPRGRATLLKEWLRLQAAHGIDIAALEQSAPKLWTNVISGMIRRRDRGDFSHNVYTAMATCLACKACAQQCPVKIDIPEARSRFLALYHRRYRRRLREYWLALLETSLTRFSALLGVITTLAPFSTLINAVLQKFGLIDLPRFSSARLRRELLSYTPRRQKNARKKVKKKSSLIVIYCDPLTSSFRAEAALGMVHLAKSLGYAVVLINNLPTGKPLHVLGFRHRFAKQAQKTQARLVNFQAQNVPMIGVDPAMTLLFRQEYRAVLRKKGAPFIPPLLPQEWLSTLSSERKSSPEQEHVCRKPWVLLLHCSESTSPTLGEAWICAFNAAGLTLEIRRLGCCGMSGIYGHFAENKATSERVFEQSWGREIDSCESERLMTTGLSCACQVKRFRGLTLPHPAQILSRHGGKTTPR